MASRELGLWEVLDVLRRVHRGETKSAIERVTGRTRKTIHGAAAVPAVPYSGLLVGESR